MKRLQAYQPNGAQRRDMRRFAGACRFVFNRALAWQKDRYTADSTTKFSYTVLANFLPAWKKDKETEWLKHSPSQCLQQAQFVCVACGVKENADVIGAINVLRAGHAQFACEVSGTVMPPAAGTHRSDSGTAQCRP